MKKYVGVKVVEAVEMTRNVWLDKNGLALEEPDVAGFEVTYPPVGDRERYVSWCPADAFLQHNRPVDGVTAGMALEGMRAGMYARRKGWKNKILRMRQMDKFTPGYVEAIYRDLRIVEPPEKGRLNSVDLGAEDWVLMSLEDTVVWLRESDDAGGDGVGMNPCGDCEAEG